MEHSIDTLTGYCLGCGAALEIIEDSNDRICPKADNVVAISHIICRNKSSELLKTLDIE